MSAFTSLLNGHVHKACMAIALCLMTSCGGETAQETAARDAPKVQQQEPIAPDDFVFVPCAGVKPEALCVIVAAGGKRVLIGAPAGIGAGQIPGDAILPDGVILPSLAAKSIEGLDEVRNAAWRSGRRGPLPVSGVRGVEQFVAALNEAYVASDALAYLEGAHKGGFDTQAMIARPVVSGTLAFDTGDLQIMALAGPAGELALLVAYHDQHILLAGCGAMPNVVASWPLADAYIGCDLSDYGSPKLGDWPLKARLKILPD